MTLKATNFYGIYRGKVQSNKDPLNQGRLKVRVPQILADQVTGWAWPIETPSANFQLPEVGQGVWVQFEGGDTNFPIWGGQFGKELSGDYSLKLEKLKADESLATIETMMAIDTQSSGEKELDVTQTLLNLARKLMERNYGSFYDTTTQTLATLNTPQAIRINTVDFASNVTLVTGTKITIANVGTYNLQWSGQFANSGTSAADVRVWLRYNGVDYPQSASIVTIPAKHGSVSGHCIAAWNWLGKSQATGDYVEIWWVSDSADVSLIAYPANSGPAVPSVIVTLTECE